MKFPCLKSTQKVQSPIFNISPSSLNLLAFRSSKLIQYPQLLTGVTGLSSRLCNDPTLVHLLLLNQPKS